MTDVVFVFEVHQPFRIRKDFFWGRQMFHRLRRGELFHYYFDRDLDRAMFEKASTKCYIPANRIILNMIDQHRRERKRVEVSYSLSLIHI